MKDIVIGNKTGYIVIFKEWGHCDNPNYYSINEFDSIDEAINYINETFAEDDCNDMELMAFYRGRKIEYKSDEKIIEKLRKKYLDKEEKERQKTLLAEENRKEIREKILYEKLKEKFGD